MHNIRKSRQVRGVFGRYFKGRGKETTVLAKIYRVLVQAVLFFGAETWVLTEKMSQRLEGLHVIFLRQVTRKQAKRRRDGSWRQIPTEEVLQGAGKQTLRIYVVRRQATVAEWVATRPIFICVCDRRGTKEGGDYGCRGGGRKQRRTS